MHPMRISTACVHIYCKLYIHFFRVYVHILHTLVLVSSIIQIIYTCTFPQFVLINTALCVFICTIHISTYLLHIFIYTETVRSLLSSVCTYCTYTCFEEYTNSIHVCIPSICVDIYGMYSTYCSYIYCIYSYVHCIYTLHVYSYIL